jgi:hypothetical protein
MNRIFSKNKEDVNYSDYLKIKKGTVLLNNANKDDVTVLHKFIDYNTFLTLTHAFYYKRNKDEFIIKPPVCVIDAAESYIYDKEKINSCHDDPDNGIIRCKELQQILYPYGNSIENTDNFYFPNNIIVEDFCKPTLCKSIQTPPFYISNSEKVTVFTEEPVNLKVKRRKTKNPETLSESLSESLSEEVQVPKSKNLESTALIKIKRKDPEVV